MLTLNIDDEFSQKKYNYCDFEEGCFVCLKSMCLLPSKQDQFKFNPLVRNALFLYPLKTVF